MRIYIESSIKFKLVKVTLSCRTQLDDKSHLLFVYTVTASTSKSFWILIIDIIEQPIKGLIKYQENWRRKVESKPCWINADPFLTIFGQKLEF